MTRTCIAVAALAALLTGACSHRGVEPDEGVEAVPAAAVSMAVSVAPVERAPMSEHVTLLGVSAAMRRLTIRAPAAGRVADLSLQAGDAVSRGQLVAHIINRESEAARAGQAIADRLDPEHAVALDQAVRRFTSGPGIAVLAPQSATVSQRLASSGQMVAAFDPLVELVDLASIYVEAQAPVDVAGRLGPGMAADVTSPLHPGVEFPARIAALSPSFSQAGATVPVRISFVGPRRIREAGAPVQVRVTLKAVADALVVPASAIFQNPDTGGGYVFVVGADGRAHRTAVTLGIQTLTRVQVTRGLSVGQSVITSGGYALSEGLAVHPAASLQP